MEEVSPFAEVLGHLFYKFTILKPLLPMYGHILVAALFPIFIAAHASLSRPSSAAKPPKKDDDEVAGEEGEEEPSNLYKTEGFQPKDALIFPLVAGGTLCTLYLVLKWMEDATILNQALGIYFCHVGVYFMKTFVKDSLVVLRSFVFPRQYHDGKGKIWKVDHTKCCFVSCGHGRSSALVETRRSPLPGPFGMIPLPDVILGLLWFCRYWMYQRIKFQGYVRGIQKVSFTFGLVDFISLFVSMVACGYFGFVAKPWWLTNLLGLSFCYCSLQIMSPSTFWTGTLLLGSLFIYDIYFVFFTPLMVTVATKVDAPVKLLFPRPPSPEEAEVNAFPLAMLGLGDIVLPGMIMCLALRFDLFLYYKRKGVQKAQAEGEGKKFVAPQYQCATGGWGERLWARTGQPSGPELEPPYHDARSFPKTYFGASIMGYILGMVSTLLAMAYFEHGQPALLYLVPGVLSFLWGTALRKGDISEMWNFADASEDEEEEEETDKKDEKAVQSASDDTKPFVSSLLSVYPSLLSIFSSDTPDKSHKKDKTEDDRAGSPKEKDSEPGTPTEAKQDDKDKDKENHECGRVFNLFSLSISFRKVKSKEHGSSIPQTDKSKEQRPIDSSKFATCEDASDDDAHPTWRDSEPPTKRRRRSPRHTGTA